MKPPAGRALAPTRAFKPATIVAIAGKRALRLDFNRFCDSKSVLKINSKISDGAVHLLMAQ